jgi:protein-S-isoprenylcysteine O-methyltransferase Ste14
MPALPPLEPALSNAWLFLIAYALGLVLALSRFSTDDRERVFADPKTQLHGIKRLALHLGQLVAIAFILLMVFTPITHSLGLLASGSAIYLLGTSTVIVALRSFRLEVKGKPAKHGLYRVSRNPQWVGLFLVLIGTAIVSGAWLPIAMVVLVGCIYHLQILEEERACASIYGEEYLLYLGQVPRYFLWL